VIRQYEQTLAAYGIETEFEDAALERIAALAAQEQTGARGLMTVCERVLRGFKYELPSTSVKQLKITAATVDDADAALRQLLEEHLRNEERAAHDLVHSFAKEFSAAHSLTIRFTEAAADLLVGAAKDQNHSLHELCRSKFKDFQFGLKLIAQNTGQKEFLIDTDAVQEPEKILSEWVVRSYRKEA